MRGIRPIAITDAVLTGSNVVETEAAWSSATTYAKGAVVRGAEASAHLLYESLQAANTNHPLTDALWWLPLGATNRWKLFDGSYTSQTSATGLIQVELAAGVRLDSVAFLNVDAAEGQLTMVDPVKGVVFNQTIPLISTDGVDNWFAYFNEPVVRLVDKAVFGLPPYPEARLVIAIAAPGGTAKIGGLMTGLSRDLGGTRWGARGGIQDFSKKVRNERGDVDLRPGAYANTAGFTLVIPAGRVDGIKALLTTWRAIPIVYVGDDTYGSTLVYGYFTDFEITIPGPVVSEGSLQVEGLV